MGGTRIGSLFAACPGLHISHSTCNKFIFRLLSGSVLQVTHVLTLHLLVQRPRSPASWAVRPLSPAAAGGGVWRGPAPPPPRLRPQPGGERLFRSHEPPARQPRPGPLPPLPSLPPAVPATATGRLPIPILQPPPRRCAALPAPRAREGAAEEPPPAPGPGSPRPGPRHGALAAAAPRAARLGLCGPPRRAAPTGTMSPLLRRLLLAALLQLARTQVCASTTSSMPARPRCPLKVGGSREAPATSAEGIRWSNWA